MTDLDRLIAAGNKLATLVDGYMRELSVDGMAPARYAIELAVAMHAWRVLAREVKQSGGGVMNECPQHETLSPEHLDQDGNHYCYWLMRLTADDMHSKSSIAVTLAWYRKQCAALEAELANANRRSEFHHQNHLAAEAELSASRERERVLREAIENAPHAHQCPAVTERYLNACHHWVEGNRDVPLPHLCNCWKARTGGSDGN